jgi:hypothetical protein
LLVCSWQLYLKWLHLFLVPHSTYLVVFVGNYTLFAVIVLKIADLMQYNCFC